MAETTSHQPSTLACTDRAAASCTQAREHAVAQLHLPDAQAADLFWPPTVGRQGASAYEHGKACMEAGLRRGCVEALAAAQRRVIQPQFQPSSIHHGGRAGLAGPVVPSRATRHYQVHLPMSRFIFPCQNQSDQARKSGSPEGLSLRE
eukprot:3666528-Rhodomonas_salina.3